jgi:NADP-dependent 3-hydroxy acid dehydrogenase YdfG
VKSVVHYLEAIALLANNAGATEGGSAVMGKTPVSERVVSRSPKGNIASTRAVAAESIAPHGRETVICVSSAAALGGNQVGGIPTIAC